MANIETRLADDGTRSYRAKVRLKGHRPESATFARLTDARRWAQATEAAMREGRHFKTAEARGSIPSPGCSRQGCRALSGRRGP